MRIIKKKITNEEIAEMPVRSFEGTIIVVDDENKAEDQLNELLGLKLLGFDTETRPSFKKGERHQVALLQLSTHDKAFLLRVDKIGIPNCIQKILQDENVKKAGVAVHDDIKALQTVNDFIPAGFVELQTYVDEFGIEDKGLKKLSCSILGFRISKSARLSNWENDEYTEEQKQYAATDAWVSFEIYKLLSGENGEFKIVD
jgi:ribonuclease D